MRPGQRNREANIWTARFVPLFLLAIIGYSSWAFTKLVCVDYLLNPAPSLFINQRTGPAIAILTIYYVLLLILLICYGRLVQTIITNPGLVPRGPQWYVEQGRKTGQNRKQDATQKEEALDAESTEGFDTRFPKRRSQAGQAGIQISDFWHKDVFICNYDGRPRFCSTCYNIKPDRAHHCSELDRCVFKMDHFCPWVGGIVSETSFKYFIEFTLWTALYTLYTLVVMAYYFAERRRKEGFINVHWILVLAFAALFFVFGAGMCGSSLQFAFENTTTIENLNKRSKVHYIATYVPQITLERIHSSGRTDLRLITYPRPPSEQLEVLQHHGAEISPDQQIFAQSSIIPPPSAAKPPGGTDNGRVQAATLNPIPPLTRTFAILETKPGANPFDIGYFNNFKEVMGYSVIDWLFPIHASPLTKHDDPESMYRMGRVVYRLRRDAGLLEEEQRRTRSHRGKRRRRRSSAASGPRGSGNV